MILEKDLDGSFYVTGVIDKSPETIKRTVNSLLSFWTIGYPDDLNEALSWSIERLIEEKCLFEPHILKRQHIKNALEYTDYEEYIDIVFNITKKVEDRAKRWPQEQKDFFVSCFSLAFLGHDFSSLQGDYKVRSDTAEIISDVANMVTKKTQRPQTLKL